MVQESFIRRAPSSAVEERSVNLAAANNSDAIGRNQRAAHANFTPMGKTDLEYLERMGARILQDEDKRLYKVEMDRADQCYKRALALLEEHMPEGKWKQNLPGLVFVVNDDPKFAGLYFEDSNNLVFGLKTPPEQIQTVISHEFGHAYLKNSDYDAKVRDFLKGEYTERREFILKRVLNESFAYYFEALSSNLIKKPANVSPSEDILYNMLGRSIRNRDDADECANVLKAVHDLVKAGSVREALGYGLDRQTESRRTEDEERIEIESNTSVQFAALVLFANGKNVKKTLDTLSSTLEDVAGKIRSLGETDLQESMAQVRRIPTTIATAEESVPMDAGPPVG